jgi:hypothetical protein
MHDIGERTRSEQYKKESYNLDLANRASVSKSSVPWVTEHPGPSHLLVSHRTSWGILPQTPVFSLRSAPLSPVQPNGFDLTSRSFAPVNKSSYFLGDPPPDPRFLASLGPLSPVQPNCLDLTSRSFAPVNKSSYFLGNPPQTPVFSLRSARCHRYSPTAFN